MQNEKNSIILRMFLLGLYEFLLLSAAVIIGFALKYPELNLLTLFTYSIILVMFLVTAVMAKIVEEQIK